MPTDWTKDVNWEKEFRERAAKFELTVSAAALTHLRREIRRKRHKFKDASNVSQAVIAVAELAAESAKKREREKISTQDIVDSLKDCPVYPLC